MDPELVKMLNAELGTGVSRRSSDVDLAFSRQRDGAAYDMRMLGAFVTGNLFASDDPERFAGLNAGVRVPTTLDHPNAKVG